METSVPMLKVPKTQSYIDTVRKTVGLLGKRDRNTEEKIMKIDSYK